MKVCAIILGLSMNAGAALAGDIPRLDVGKACNSDYPVATKNCIAAQQDAYDEIKALWNEVPEKDQTYCGRYAPTFQPYTGMLNCVRQSVMNKRYLEQQRERAARQGPFRY